MPAISWRALSGCRGPRTSSTSTPPSRTQKAGDTQIFIDLRPMNDLAVAEELPLFPLFSRCVKEAREPCERDHDLSAVGQIDGAGAYPHGCLKGDGRDRARRVSRDDLVLEDVFRFAI